MVTCAIFGIFAGVWYRLLDKRIAGKWARVAVAVALGLLTQMVMGFCLLAIDPTLAD